MRHLFYVTLLLKDGPHSELIRADEGVSPENFAQAWYEDPAVIAIHHMTPITRKADDGD